MEESVKEKMNGSVNLLADAMRKVFTEAMEVAVQPVRSDMEGMETRINKNMSNMEDRLNQRIDTTNENMQAQFSQQEKTIGKLLKTPKSTPSQSKQT
ncbi:MAG: hypothetical protein J4F49_06090 [Rhodobacteraceae bacterium]|nr:hypothetical protein [Paracoccaceae bacterium]